MNQPVHIIFGHRAIFIPHDGMAKAHLSRLDQFAEHIANGLTPYQAAKRMGKDHCYGNAMMQKLRKKMGDQAR